ncbi:hypothetical protein ACFSQU_01345 [Massilia sp. GCM10020059]|uniref:Uncharacterized protein n=1 Tax=Massilia agrisoli TaxID=2892444 RepID=A0ABS8IQ16_9BURK|nr:hypothetical protein [Massilia agrisoli]MCC6070727.1 hypothetical protein [Massilia agrisoli]
MTSLTFDTTEVFILSANPTASSAAGSLALTAGCPPVTLLPAFAVAALLILLPAAVAREAGLAVAAGFAFPLAGAGTASAVSVALMAGFVSLLFMMPPL